MDSKRRRVRAGVPRVAAGAVAYLLRPCASRLHPDTNVLGLKLSHHGAAVWSYPGRSPSPADVVTAVDGAGGGVVAPFARRPSHLEGSVTHWPKSSNRRREFISRTRRLRRLIREFFRRLIREFRRDRGPWDPAANPADGRDGVLGRARRGSRHGGRSRGAGPVTALRGQPRKRRTRAELATDPTGPVSVDKTEAGYDAIVRRCTALRRSGRLPYHWLTDATRRGYFVDTSRQRRRPDRAVRGALPRQHLAGRGGALRGLDREQEHRRRRAR